MPFSSVPSLGIGSSANLGMPRNENFLPRITEAIPSPFRGIFWERNSVANPSAHGAQINFGDLTLYLPYGLCSTTGKPTRSFATERVSLDSV